MSEASKDLFWLPHISNASYGPAPCLVTPVPLLLLSSAFGPRRRLMLAISKYKKEQVTHQHAPRPNDMQIICCSRQFHRAHLWTTARSAVGGSGLQAQLRIAVCARPCCLAGCYAVGGGAAQAKQPRGRSSTLLANAGGPGGHCGRRGTVWTGQINPNHCKTATTGSRLQKVKRTH